MMLSNLSRKKQPWLLTQHSHLKPSRKQGKPSSQAVTAVAVVATTGEKSRVPVPSRRMPHLPKSNRLRVLHVHSVTATITAWRTAQVSRRRLLQKERHLFRKQEYVLVVSVTATRQEDVETGRCAKLAVCPTRPFFMMKARFPPSIVAKTKQELFGQSKQLAAVQVPVMLLEPPILSQTMIVPVRMHHQDNPERQVVIYALLDPASNGTFIKESILEELQVNGVETQLKLNTMHGSEVVPTRKVGGLIVQRMDGEVHIELPKTYSRNEIPSRRNEIPRPESAAKWPHPSHLANKIYPYQEDLQVGLLIGSNCPNAIKPKQVIPGRSSDPYAIRTLLGWGIIGPVTGSTNKEDLDVSCHIVAVKEIGSEELPSHRFVVETLVKEIISPEAVKSMFERDFNEVNYVAQQTLSIDDRRFIAKVKQGITHRSDGHYECHCHYEMNL